jgi:MFS family permease
MYLGLVVGFLVFGYLGDNFGRRRGLIYALGVNVFGNVFISSSFNLPMISVGLIIAMGSIFPAMNMTLHFFN